VNSFEPLPFSFVFSRSLVYKDGAERRTLGGVIHCTSDGKDVAFTYGEYHQPTEGSSTSEVEVEEPQQEDEAINTYILNTGSMKFHTPDCSAVAQMSESNRKEYTGSREKLIEQGYTPCGYCKP
jgi:DNA-entry nuclease